MEPQPTSPNTQIKQANATEMDLNVHKHYAKYIKIMPFNGSVNYPENKSAHGNVCVLATCLCGAVRRTNINGQHFEKSEWNESSKKLLNYRNGRRNRRTQNRLP